MEYPYMISLLKFCSLNILLSAAIIPLTAGAASSSISGTATYRERMALPPDAVFEAVIEDVSRADVMAERMGIVRIEKVGPIPVHFEILYDETQIQENHTYAVRCRIMSGGKLLFTTDTHYPVITRGHGNKVELLLKLIPNRRADYDCMDAGGRATQEQLPSEA